MLHPSFKKDLNLLYLLFLCDDMLSDEELQDRAEALGTDYFKKLKEESKSMNLDQYTILTEGFQMN